MLLDLQTPSQGSGEKKRQMRSMRSESRGQDKRRRIVQIVHDQWGFCFQMTYICAQEKRNPIKINKVYKIDRINIDEKQEKC